MLKRMTPIALATGMGLATLATPASATLYFYLDITVGGISKVLSCNALDACNTSGSPDELTLAPTSLNGVSIRGEDDFASGTPTNSGPDYLYSTVGNVKNTNSKTATITVFVSDTSFAAPVNVANLAANGTFLFSKGSTYNSNWFVDAANGQGAVGGATPGVNIQNFALTPPVTSNNQGVGYTSPNLSLFLSAPFSVTLETTYTLAADGTLTNRGQSAVFMAVPETSTWLMMLFGFASLGYAGYRKTAARFA